MAENETELVTELTFTAETILDAALLIFNMILEGQNNHEINFAEIDGISQLEGRVLFDRPNTPDLRLWVETKAAGVGSGKFALKFESVDLLNPVPLDSIPAVATA